MLNQFSRTQIIYGENSIKKLADSRVAVFGLGGVGGYALEALARAGVGALDLIDNDKISLTNLNRQILALHSTVGEYKTEAALRRVLDINPNCKVTIHNTFYLPETAGEFDFKEYDYIIDAVDTVTAKLTLIENAKKSGVPVISSMGTGNKIDAAAFKVADIYETSGCPLARIMRKELKKRSIDSLKVVFSPEEPVRDEESACIIEAELASSGSTRRDIPGSVSFVPATAGLLMAGEVINDLIYNK